MADTDDTTLPNILLVVWDACRYDYAVEHASFLNELRSSNLWFENAIAPSPWSLPSHASIFTGNLPHEHGMNRLDDDLDTPLVRKLSDKGYTCYGVSANGFASQRTGFHEDFDDFRYTGGRDLYVDGMDVSGTAQKMLRKEGTSYSDVVKSILRKTPSHDHSIKTLANLFAAPFGELSTKFEGLQRIPHPIFAPTSDYSYNPEKNTETIRSLLKAHDGEDPFFLFTNYMDTHRCYKPSEALQKKHLGRSLSYKELLRLNEEVAAPWPFEEKKARQELDDSDIEDVQSLYAGEVETVDSHLQQIHEMLESEGLLEDTLIVVTADHGENLGETDEMGKQRMGHEASVSDAVLHVPMVVSHPTISEKTISHPFSLNHLFDLCLNATDIPLRSIGQTLENTSERVATSQYPATGGGEETMDKFPDASKETIQYRSSEHTSVGYYKDWKIVVDSTGEEWSKSKGQDYGIDKAPKDVVELVQKYLGELNNSESSEISKKDLSQLKALGYV